MIKMILISCIFTIFMTVTTSTYAKDPFGITINRIRFSASRCADGLSNSNITLQNIWSERDFNNDSATHCYIKCFFYKVGLIDLRSRGIDQWRFFEMLDNFGNYSNETCLYKFKFSEPLNGRCVSYYQKFIELRTQCPELTEYVFVKSISKAIPFNSTSIHKAIGESASEFCNRTMDQSNSTTAVDSILSEVIQPAFKCDLACIFRQFNYFDSYGRLDESEISRSYRESNLSLSIDFTTIRMCTGRGNAKYDGRQSCDMALELGQCLLQETHEFPRVFFNLDLISRQY